MSMSQMKYWTFICLYCLSFVSVQSQITTYLPIDDDEADPLEGFFGVIERDESDQKILSWFEKTWTAMHEDWLKLRNQNINPFDHHLIRNSSAHIMLALKAIMQSEKMFRILITDHGLEIVRSHLYSLLDINDEDIKMLHEHLYEGHKHQIQPAKRSENSENNKKGQFLLQNIRGMFGRALNMLNLE